MERAISSYKTDISKRSLLFAAGLIWLASGCFLINGGADFIFENSHHILFHLLISLISGILLFFIVFFRISNKHTNRILTMTCEKTNIFFSFANYRNYILLFIIIIVGLALKRTEIINHLNLSIAFTCMGISMLLSSLKFFYSIATFKKLTKSKKFSAC